MFPARARTQVARPGVERTSRGATAPPTNQERERWKINTWKAALRADVRSFLAVEPNTPPDAEDDEGRNEDLDEDDEMEDHCG